MFRKDLRKRGRRGIEENRFAIKFTRYEGSAEPIHRLRELRALVAIGGHEKYSHSVFLRIRMHVYIVLVRFRLVLMSLETRSKIYFRLSTS